MPNDVVGTLPLPPGGPIEAVHESSDAIFNWRYDLPRASLMNLYEKGKHGFGLGGTDPVLSSWPSRCADWLRLHGVAPAERGGK